MYDISIPDGLYKRVSQAAQAHQVSVEAFVAEALRLRLDEDVSDVNVQAMFTSERLDLIDVAEAEIDAGSFLTSDQVSAHFAEKKASWMQSHGK